MKIVLEYNDGAIEELDCMPRSGHKLNGNRPIKITTTGVQKFDESGKYLTQEYSLLTNLLGREGKIFANEIQIVYEEVLIKYMYHFNKFIDVNYNSSYNATAVKCEHIALNESRENKDVLERLFCNLIEPAWYTEWTKSIDEIIDKSKRENR